jgi:hypothetical protein
MGEVIQLQGDQRKDVQEFLTDKKEGLELDAKTIKVRKFTHSTLNSIHCVLIQNRSTASKAKMSRPISSSCHLEIT